MVEIELQVKEIVTERLMKDSGLSWDQKEGTAIIRGLIFYPRDEHPILCHTVQSMGLLSNIFYPNDTPYGHYFHLPNVPLESVKNIKPGQTIVLSIDWHIKQFPSSVSESTSETATNEDIKLYHGTTFWKALKILLWSLSSEAENNYSESEPDSLFFTTSIEVAEYFGRRAYGVVPRLPLPTFIFTTQSKRLRQLGASIYPDLICCCIEGNLPCIKVEKRGGIKVPKSELKLKKITFKRFRVNEPELLEGKFEIKGATPDE